VKHDIVVENFRPGVIQRLGLNFSELQQARPDLIWCSISGFGQDGPYKEKPAYDMIVQALSGGMSLTGEVDGASVRAGIPIGDISAGLYGAIGILAAFSRRNVTGQGEFIDVSMLDCQVAMLSYQAAYHLHCGAIPGHQGRAHDSIATYRTFTAKDGIDVCICANTERMWKGLCSSIERPELVSDKRFTSVSDRYANRQELWAILDQAFTRRSADEWVSILEREQVPVGVVNTLDRVMADPQVKHRNLVVELSDGDGRRSQVIGNPIVLEKSGRRQNVFPPKLGEHTTDILRELLGMNDGEIDAAVKAGGLPSLRPEA
jgi:crotonobetainyl-CoA:carnitine CoA-transferase CaiB-like acyl-CoA transferase